MILFSLQPYVSDFQDSESKETDISFEHPLTNNITNMDETDLNINPKLKWDPYIKFMKLKYFKIICSFSITIPR